MHGLSGLGVGVAAFAIAACDVPGPSVDVELDVPAVQVQRTPTGVVIRADVDVSLSSTAPTQVVLDRAEATVLDEHVELDVDASQWPVAIGEGPVQVSGLALRLEREGACQSPTLPLSLYVSVRGVDGLGAEGYFIGEVAIGPTPRPLEALFSFAWKTASNPPLSPQAAYLPSIVTASDDAVLYRTGATSLVRADAGGASVLATDVSSFAASPDGGAVVMLTDELAGLVVELRRVSATGEVLWSSPIDATDSLLGVVGSSEQTVLVSGMAGSSLRIGAQTFPPNEPFLAAIDMTDGSVDRFWAESVIAAVPGPAGSMLATTASFEATGISLLGLTLFDADLQPQSSTAFVPHRLSSASDGSIAAMVGAGAVDARVATGVVGASAFTLTERPLLCLELDEPGSIVALEGGEALVATSPYDGGSHWLRIDADGNPSHDATSIERVEVASRGEAVYVAWTSPSGATSVGRIDRATLEEVLP